MARMKELHSILAFGAMPDLNVVYNVVGHDKTSYQKDSMIISKAGDRSLKWYLQNIFGDDWAGKKIIVRTLSNGRKSAEIEVIDTAKVSTEPIQWKRLIAHHYAALKVDHVYTIKEFSYSHVRLLENDNVVENPFLDEKLHKGRQFKVLVIGPQFAEIEVLPPLKVENHKLCGYSNCTLHACIESDYCLDHQYQEKLRRDLASIEANAPKCGITGCEKRTSILVEPDQYFTFCDQCRASLVAPVVPDTKNLIPPDPSYLTKMVPDSYKSSLDYALVQAFIKASETVSVPTGGKESLMNGTVYVSAVVVKNETVAAGVGVTTGVTRSRVVYNHNRSFVATSIDNARALVLASASIATKDIDLEDTTVTYEVKLVAAV